MLTKVESAVKVEPVRRVGSTNISAGLDAEDWRDLVSAYLDAASAAVTEMGGHVAKKLGDGLWRYSVIRWRRKRR